MKESIKELLNECINNCDLISLLMDLDNHVKNVNDENSDIVFNHHKDKKEFLSSLNTLSLKELKKFVDKLEDELVSKILELSDSVHEKLYDAGI